MRLDRFRGSKHKLGAIGNELAPELPARVADRHGHQAKGTPAGICANVKHAVSRIRGRCRMSRGERARMMFRVVFVVVLALCNEPEFSAGLIGAQVANLAGRIARTGQEKTRAAARAFHSDSKSLVSLVVE